MKIDPQLSSFTNLQRASDNDAKLRSKMQAASTIVLPIPQGVPPNRIGLKKASLERKYNGLQCHVDGPARRVTLNGSDSHLNDAKRELEKLFDQMAMTAPPTARALPKTSHRSFVALDPDATFWRFVPTRSNVSDVKTCDFPFELERSPTKSEQQPRPTSDRPQDLACTFLGEFNDQYLEREADKLNNTQERDDLKVKAVFGRKLFSCETVEPGVEYHVDALRAHHRDDRFRAQWSNICDADGPELKALISELNAVRAELGVTPCKQEITVRLERFGGNWSDELKVKYLRENGEWTYKSTKRLSGFVVAHDISLANRVNFRVRVYSKSQQVSSNDPRAQELHSMVVIQGPEDGEDIFSSQVTPLKGARARVQWVSTKSVTVVPLHGVEFRMVQLGEGELLLEALLPEASGMPLGDKVKLLVEKLRTLVTNSGGGDDDRATMNGECP